MSTKTKSNWIVRSEFLLFCFTIKTSNLKVHMPFNKHFPIMFKWREQAVQTCIISFWSSTLLNEIMLDRHMTHLIYPFWSTLSFEFLQKLKIRPRGQVVCNWTYFVDKMIKCFEYRLSSSFDIWTVTQIKKNTIW